MLFGAAVLIGPAQPPSVPAETAERLRRWAREALALGTEEHVLVTHLACSEPGCPPIETAVSAQTERGRVSVSLHCLASEVDRGQLSDALDKAYFAKEKP